MRNRHFARWIGTGLVVALCSGAFAQTGPQLLLKPFPKEKDFELNLAANFLNKGESDNGDVDFRLSIYDASGRYRFPIFEGLKRAEPRFGFNITTLDIDTDDPAIPGQLSDVSIGLGFGIAEVDGWIAGIAIGIGHASSNTFGDANGWYGMATLAVGKVFSDESALGFVLDYDGNRSFMPDTPLPGFQYRRPITKELVVAVGFPLNTVTWKPNDQLTIEATYVMPDNITGRISYNFFPEFGVYAEYSRRVELFHDNDIPNRVDRLIFEQQQVELGLRWDPTESITVLGAIGYAFDQDFRVGFDTRDTEKVARISDEIYFRIGFEMRL